MKNPTIILAVTALLLSAPALAQEGGEPAPKRPDTGDLCAHVQCQYDMRVTLKDRDGSTYDHTFVVVSPIVQPDGFIVLAGQTVYIEADVVDGKLVNLVAVDKVTNPAKTIVAHFEQVNGKDMMLTVSNPFRQVLKFDMGIRPLGQNGFVKTSSCAIGPGMKSFESWPFPIFQVALGRGHVVEGGGISCSE